MLSHELLYTVIDPLPHASLKFLTTKVFKSPTCLSQNHINIDIAMVSCLFESAVLNLPDYIWFQTQPADLTARMQQTPYLSLLDQILFA